MRSALFHRLIEMRFWEEKEKSSGHGLDLVVMFLLLDSDPEHTKKGREKLSRGQRWLFLKAALP